jgi:hypothetical protein
VREVARQRPSMYEAHAKTAALKIAEGSDKTTVYVDLIGGVEPDPAGELLEPSDAH